MESERIVKMPKIKDNYEEDFYFGAQVTETKSSPTIFVNTTTTTTTTSMRKIENHDNKLSLGSKKGITGLILLRVSSFHQHLKGKLTVVQSQEFNKLIKQMISYIEQIDETIKGYRADSIADSLLLLVGSQVGVSKSDFLKNLKIGEKVTGGRINEIKKFHSYKHLKKGLKAILAKKC